MDLGLSEKVAIVCASSKGLGKSISLGLSREGAFVVICARHEEDLIQTRQVIQNETGGEVMSVVADVSNPEEVDNLVEIAMERFDGIDILINNSGGPKAGGFDDLNSANQISFILLIFILALLSIEIYSRKEARYHQPGRGFKPINKIKLSGKKSLIALSFCSLVFFISFVFPVSQMIYWTLKFPKYIQDILSNVLGIHFGP